MNISRKSILKMMGYLFFGGIFGFVISMLLRYVGKSEHLNILISIREFLISNSVYLFPLLFLIFFVPVYIFGKIGKKELNQAIDLPDDLYDDHINEAEKKIDISLSLNSIFMVINFIFLCMSFEPRVAQIYVFLGLFLFNILVISLYEISTIRFIQQNDERLKGDPVSFRFRKDFFNSCDEAEKQKILKTSYHGFNLARNVSFALLIMTILSHMILETGIYAIFISGFMLLAIMGGYSYYAIFK